MCVLIMRSLLLGVYFRAADFRELPCGHWSKWLFPKVKAPILGVLRTRALLFGGCIWLLVFGNSHLWRPWGLHISILGPSSYCASLPYSRGGPMGPCYGPL